MDENITPPPTPPEPVMPTQVAHPARASWRTVLQTVLGAILTLGFVLPVAVQIIGEELGDYLPPNVMAVLLTVSAVIVAVSGAVARIMAIKKVDAALSRIGIGARPAAH